MVAQVSKILWELVSPTANSPGSVFPFHPFARPDFTGGTFAPAIRLRSAALPAAIPTCCSRSHCRSSRRTSLPLGLRLRQWVRRVAGGILVGSSESGGCEFVSRFVV